ncbi:hypothetical protein [Micromonospora humida]|uniref:Uncharacterized protein n=1 Tax=Micromonospora humida TaxID=2809018 RepID=A0ABS2J2X3_9ACTN|nr:hypothetical protein [Micromonospora humida]MBM7080916.1 hypothetical protein [Micromonospora humida]
MILAPPASLAAARFAAASDPTARARCVPVQVRVNRFACSNVSGNARTASA